MGNAAMTSSCFRPPGTSPSAAVKLITYGGATRTLTGKHLAGEIMFEFPDHMVCRADAFIIGQPIPSLSIDDELLAGETYFLLPLDCFPHSCVLLTSSLAAMGSSGDRRDRRVPPVSFKECPLEYVKGSDGRVLIKVSPEFIIRLISGENNNNNKTGSGDDGESDGERLLCSTPELKKHYSQLVGSKDQVWSPKLETISEYKIRFSPCRFMGLEWKQAEG